MVHPHDLERENDIEHLRRIALAQHAQIEQLVAALARKCTELEALKGSNDELQQTLALIEKLKEQQSLITKPGGDGHARRDKSARSSTAARDASREAPPRLPSFDHVCRLPEAELVCDSCGGAMHEMAGQFEESELVDVVEVDYHVKKVKRQKYACRCGGCIKTAPGVERAVHGGSYSLDFGMKVAIDKYLYHLPLARQARMMAEHDLVVTPQTLWDQLFVLAERLKITVAGLIRYVMEQPVIGLIKRAGHDSMVGARSLGRCGVSRRRAQSCIASAVTRAPRHSKSSSASTVA